MYLSLLRLNPLSRKTISEISRPYELHRTIMRAFPGIKDGGAGRVLFRLDINHDRSEIYLLVQSENKPDWSQLKGIGDMLLVQPEYKVLDPVIKNGMVLYFRLRANPTVKRNGKRLGIMDEAGHYAWLKRKSRSAGFELISANAVNEGRVQDKMTDNYSSSHNLTLVSVRFDGVLKVTDEDKFRTVINKGLGSGKGVGFGLLSVALVKDG